MGFPSKFDEFIESTNLISHIRARSASAAIGPNGPESAAMVCAMYARAGKSVNLCTSNNASTSSDMTKSSLLTQIGSTFAGLVTSKHVQNASVALKSHSRSWFDTDSDASCSSGSEDQNFDCDKSFTQAAENTGTDLYLSHSSMATSPPCSGLCHVTVDESSANNTVSSVVLASDMDFQDTRGTASPQHSHIPIVLEEAISLNIPPFSRDVFAPNMLPWFKAKRKSAQK
jgi:hypothetical protein